MSVGARSTTAGVADKAAGGGLGLPIAGAVAAVLLIVVGVALAWRRDEQLPTAYGRRRGGEAARSVNGTAVLADLFREKGFRVTTATRFSPRLKKYHIIVWIPDDFEPPDEDHREFLRNWLEPYGRTLIYVGRDYDAAVDYWNRIVPGAPPEFAEEAFRRQAEARANWEARRSRMPVEEDAEWFIVRRDQKPIDVQSLSGPWAEGIDAKQANLHVEGRLALPPFRDVDNFDNILLHKEFEVLLAGDGVPLVYRVSNEASDDYPWWGQRIVVTNGSFLLNYPLVNHEHRKLAAKLIEACGEPDNPEQRVLFIESDASGPRSDRPKIVTKEASGGMPTALELLKVWPLNAILLHVAVLGLVLCLARSPIFGRARELPADSPSDFGKHIAALGTLLAQTKDRNYAQARLTQYRQTADHRSKRKKK